MLKGSLRENRPRHLAFLPLCRCRLPADSAPLGLQYGAKQQRWQSRSEWELDRRHAASSPVLPLSPALTRSLSNEAPRRSQPSPFHSSREASLPTPSNLARQQTLGASKESPIIHSRPPSARNNQFSPARSTDSNRSGNGGDRGEWAQLVQSAPWKRGPSPFSRQPSPQQPEQSGGPLNQLASDLLQPARDGRRNGDKNKKFWGELETRLGSGAVGGGSWGKPSARIPWRRQNRSTTSEQIDNLQATQLLEKEQQQQHTPVIEEPGIEEDVTTPPVFSDMMDTVDEGRRARRARAYNDKEKKSKPKGRRRENRGFEPEEAEEGEYDHALRAEQRRLRAEDKRRQRRHPRGSENNRGDAAAAASEAAAQGPKPIRLPEFISVASLGATMRIKTDLFVQQLGELGFEDIGPDSIMTGETAALVAQEYGFEPTVESGATVDLRARPAPTAEEAAALPERPPIVTIMGHVDHGKTTMLDWLRKSSVAAQEHGGITQHIGAFSVALSGGKRITFLDTPGHAAFLTMRQRGARVTDIVVLVVAADDSVKPQTLEALRHARAAHVPLIVAINKIDKDEARVDQVKSDLARYGVEIEDYGGDVQVVCVSGRTGQGMRDLEEAILTLAEILDVRAETDGAAEGWVLESSVKPVGRAASVLVRRGTLHRGDVVVAGTAWARVRVLRNEAGAEIEEAPPGTPVEVLGWRELPGAGDEVLQAPTEARAREATSYRLEMKAREAAADASTAAEKLAAEKAAAAEAAAAVAEIDSAEAATESDVFASSSPSSSSSLIEVNFTVKGDVMGSVEAVCTAIMEIGNNEVRPRILRSAPGAVTEFDIEHAAATQSTIVNFNTVSVPGQMRKLAADAGVPLLDHKVIYHVIDDIKDRLAARLAPTVTHRVLGEAEVLQVFPINTRGRAYKNIAGCRVRNGQVARGSLYRVMRGKEKVFEGKLDALRQGKKDVGEMRKGTECGISFEEWDAVMPGDMVQAYEEIREKRKL